MKNKNLADARKKKGMTQEELATKLGYKGKQSVANWENGHAKPPLNKAIEVATILDCDVAVLFGMCVQDSYTNNYSA